MSTVYKLWQVCRRCIYSALVGQKIWEQQQAQPPTGIAMHLSAQETTRSIRKRLMLAAQSLVEELRLIGDFSHPEIIPILRETLRLSIPSVWLVERDLHPLVGTSNRLVSASKDWRFGSSCKASRCRAPN